MACLAACQWECRLGYRWAHAGGGALLLVLLLLVHVLLLVAMMQPVAALGCMAREAMAAADVGHIVAGAGAAHGAAPGAAAWISVAAVAVGLHVGALCHLDHTAQGAQHMTAHSQVHSRKQTAPDGPWSAGGGPLAMKARPLGDAHQMDAHSMDAHSMEEHSMDEHSMDEHSKGWRPSAPRAPPAAPGA